DPERPYWSVGGVMAVSAIAAALAIWFRHQRYVYASGLLANLAGILVWAARGPDTVWGFLAANALCLAVASAFWSAIELGLRRSWLRLSLGGPVAPFAHTAAITAQAMLVLVIANGIAEGWEGNRLRSEATLTWLGLTITVGACCLLLWDERARFAL